MDEAAKAARRVQMQRELQRLRRSRDENTSTRNRLNFQIEDLRTARHRLENCIQNMIQVKSKLEHCHQFASPKEFAGGRRKCVESQLKTASNDIHREVGRHESNLSRISSRINEINARLDNLNATIMRQNNRISELEREMRNL